MRIRLGVFGVLFWVCIFSNVFAIEYNPDESLKITDVEFSEKNSQDALRYLQESMPKLLREAKNPKDLIESSEFWISYYNSLIFVEGYTLKQEALLEKRGIGKKGALKKYQNFLKKAHYVD